MTGTVDNTIRWWAEKIPDSRALSVSDDSVTYAAFEQWTARAALHLRGRGVAPGDRVALLGANSLAWCAAAIAVIRLGGIVVPLNCRYSDAEVASIIGDSSARLVIVDAGKDMMLAEAPPAIDRVTMDAISALREGEAADFTGPFDPDATIVIAYTSGSTAKPKGVMLSNRTMLGYAFESTLNYPVIGIGARAINVAPLYTSAGIVQLVQFLCLGMTDFIEPEFDAARALHLLVHEKVEVFGGVPTFWERIAACPGFAEADLSHIGWAAVGGARVPLTLLKTYRDRGVILRQLYGLTEAGGNSTVMPAAEAVAEPEKCGRGGVFTRHRIVDATGRDAAPGEPGEILVRGPGVMTGYWNNPQATAEAFLDGWLRSGDVGIADERGNIRVVDRLKDIIISGGLNIWPLDIEAVINEIEGIDEVAVIAAPDDRFGETPLAIVHANRAITAAEIVDHCNARLANYKVPRYVLISEAPLPRLPTGKIAKRLLKDIHRNAHRELERVR